jgi:hypothetical protein
MKRIIVITEEQAKNVYEGFSLEKLKSTDWESPMDVVSYCEKCGLFRLGSGSGRFVYSIDDETVIKILRNPSVGQNLKEVDTYRKLPARFKPFVTEVMDWDRFNKNPLWIIAEQVLPASYADFQKILGIDFAGYESSEDERQMKRDLKQYSKYPGTEVTKDSVNLYHFLEDYFNGNIKEYKGVISEDKWFKLLYEMLERNYVEPWELQMIQNWGLAKRKGKPRLVILDYGI